MFVNVLEQKKIIQILELYTTGKAGSTKWKKKKDAQNYINPYHAEFLVDEKKSAEVYKTCQRRIDTNDPPNNNGEVLMFNPISAILSGSRKYDRSWSFRFDGTVWQRNTK